MNDNRTNTRYFVDTDGLLEPTIWVALSDNDDYPQPVARRSRLDAEDKALWPIAVAVFTEPGADVDNIAKAMASSDGEGWDDLPEPDRYAYREMARAALAALRSLGGA